MAVLSLPSLRKVTKTILKSTLLSVMLTASHMETLMLFLLALLPVCLFSLCAYNLLNYVFSPDKKVSSITIKAALVNFYQHKLESSGNLN